MSDFNGRREQRPQAGRGVAVPAVAAGANVNVAVTFPRKFATAPVVNPVPHDGRLNVGIVSTSTTGFTVNFANWSGSDAAATTFDWSATPA